MAKSVQQMNLSELEQAPASEEVVAELVKRLRSRVPQIETQRQARIDYSIASQLQGGSTASADDLLARAEAIEAAREAYVLARITGPSE